MSKEWSKKEITFVLSKHQAGYSRLEIARMFTKHFAKDGLTRSQDSIKHCIETHGQHIERDLPKVLIVDVETKPAKAWVWGTYDQNIPLNMVIEDGSILAWSAKFLGEKKVYYSDMRGKEKNLSNDKDMLLGLWKLMNESDILIWQNGDSFDRGKINARFIQNGLEAPAEYKTIDTLKLARRYFNFLSNKLEHLSSILNKKFKKSSHAKFPGFALWDQCIKGNKAAWREMAMYNKMDILSTEEVFLQLAKYAKNNKTVAAAMRAYNAKKKN
jgi:RNase_H superfamily